MRILKALIVTALFIIPPQARAASEPELAVAAIYKPYLQKAGSPGGPLRAKIYSARRKSEIGKLRAACKGHDFCLPDVDFLIDGQDWKITDFKLAQRAASPQSAVVDVSFENFGRRKSLVFTMVKERDAWLVDQIDGVGEKRHYNLDDSLKPNLER
jgi:hypothetical protein